MAVQATTGRLLDTSSAQREPRQQLVAGKARMIFGLANEQSITWRCAQAFRGIDGDLSIIDLREKSRTFTVLGAQTLAVPPALHVPCDAYPRAHTGQ